MVESAPRLPPELERQIFELTANSHPKAIPTLLLVAHRVKIWLEPILYSVVVFSKPIPGHVLFDPEHPSFTMRSTAVSRYIKKLCISYAEFPRRSLDPILVNGSAVQDLALVGAHSGLAPFLSRMPLRRLSTELAYLFRPACFDFTHPLFSRITHLELTDDLEIARWEDWRGLTTIPNLTHLAFLMQKSLLIFQNILTACPGLQVLIFLYFYSNPGSGLWSLAHDARFVCIRGPSFYTDWETGARGGDDFWVRAEKFIAQRNSGEIDRFADCRNRRQTAAGADERLSSALIDCSDCSTSIILSAGKRKS
ncbi:hypothetical protein C8R45DRAFT_1136197 [Mycena sanguinolenta]|nr:hypothetical protein C8R45DRAFT_1136197 [Mycena sanguinolenta]